MTHDVGELEEMCLGWKDQILFLHKKLIFVDVVF